MSTPQAPASRAASSGDLSALGKFSAPAREWFAATYDAPTPAQEAAWRAIQDDAHVLVVAPTGSGKTLAAFLWALDDVLGHGLHEDQDTAVEAVRRCRVVYVSPLKALAADVERNLRLPLAGITRAATQAGTPVPSVRIGVRTGDTPQTERRAFATRPPDILITTPESLYLVLTSAARAGLTGVRTVIVDEVHALAGTKRGAHLAVSLERLDALLDAPAQRIGLTATVDPVEPVASFLGGRRTPEDAGRPVAVVQPASTKKIVVDVVVPVPDLADLAGAPLPARGPVPTRAETAGHTVARQEPDRAVVARASMWPHLEEHVVDLVAAHNATLVFTNSRRTAERLTARLNESWARRLGLDVAEPGTVTAATVPGQSGTASALPASLEGVLARAHHGSMSRAERTRTEELLKAGALPAVVATSSLELGIDMGSLDLVIQVGAPPSVASGLQRVGRAGHTVGAVSHGVVLPTHRGELVAAAVTAERMRSGALEAITVIRNPLDVLAQQIVAMVALDDWQLADLARVLRRSAPFAELGDGPLHAVLDMLAGRYPAESFAELRPRLVWNRTTDVLSGRPGSQRLAVTSGGTIPDRGMFGVFLAGDGPPGSHEDDSPRRTTRGAPPHTNGPSRPRGGRRVGELDEEMVYETRAGDTFTLGSSTWRVEEITHDRVLVSPAPGRPGRLPFWKGDTPGRGLELGRAIGAWVREVAASSETSARTRLGGAGLDPWAQDNLLSLLTEQRAATGVVPDDRTIVVERFRDEIGDWRLVVHTPFGARVHGPWALVLAARLRARYGVDAQAVPADDGIVLRLPDIADDLADGPVITVDDLLLDPSDVASAVRSELGGSTMFAARFREAAARALLLPRRRPDQRQALWQQRQRSAQLLQIAAEHPEFPIILEAVRECLQDDFDVPGLAALMDEIVHGSIRVLDVTTPSPSPFARALQQGYTAQFLYAGDAPLAERRAAALTLDPALLADLLGTAATELADLLDPDSVVAVENELARTAPDRRARDPEGVVDLLRTHGPLSLTELRARVREDAGDDVDGWLGALTEAGRTIRVSLVGASEPEQWATVEDAGRLRDGLGATPPPGLPDAFTEAVPDPVGDLIRRHARTHGPFTVSEVSARLGLLPAHVSDVARRLLGTGALVTGRIRPDALRVPTGEPDLCDVDVLRLLRRRSLAALRAEVEPVDPTALARFLPRWHGVGTLRGADGLLRVIGQLSGAVMPASAVEQLVLPARVVDYEPAMLDTLLTRGEVVWRGHGALAGRDGLVSLHLAELADRTLPSPADQRTAAADRPPLEPLAAELLEALTGSGASFFSAVQPSLSTSATTPELVEAAWQLVWQGLVTNDSWAALRARLARGSTTHTPRSTPGRARPWHMRSLAMRGLTPAVGADPQLAGRWSPTATGTIDETARLHTLAGVLLDRHGVLTRAVAPSEGVSAQFSAIYRVLSAMEHAGQVRRGYFVEHLGGSQFAVPDAVDALRSGSEHAEGLVLAATDPANAYGAALPWPTSSTAEPPSAEASRHRPGRKAGAVVVLVDGRLTHYLERGGRTLLTFTSDRADLTVAAEALAATVRTGRLGRVSLRTLDGASVLDRGTLTSVAAQALLTAGFSTTPSGLRLRPAPRPSA